MKTAVSPPTRSAAAETPDRSEWIRLRGAQIMRREAAAVEDAAGRLGAEFVEAVRMILNARGRMAVSGLGKAGDIAKKIQSTLASTKTPAYLLHPVEALHGDLGMVTADDVLLALSRSGETEELASLLPVVSKIGCPIILMTANVASRCAKQADVVLDIGDTPEACPLGMAPSASTAAMLALGDALALTVMELRGVQAEQYAQVHPGGTLGRQLMRVHEIMRTGADCPRVRPQDTLADYYQAVHRAPRRAGAAVVTDDAGCLVGIFTHGDLARLIAAPQHPASRRIDEVMTPCPKFILAHERVVEAIRIMRPLRIDELPVVDEQHRVVGMIDIQDLLSTGFACFDEA